MQPKAAKLIEDVRDAAAFIDEVTGPLDRDGFVTQRVVRQAVERNFQIIGEAVRRLSASDPDTAARLGPVARIVAFRNVIVHGYDILDPEVVWSVIETDLPVLLESATALLREAEE
jgi:uncharacterized protein with HEPN domain